METNLPALNVTEFTSIMQQAPDVLKRNELSVSNCNAAGQSLIDTIEGAGGIASDDLDAKVSQYIERVKVTVKEMNDRRKPFTQLLTQVSKAFTTLEGNIDLKSPESIPAKLQEHRNKYAANKIAEAERQKAEAERKRGIEVEKEIYRVSLKQLLDIAYADFTNRVISHLNEQYKNATLDNYFSTVKAVQSWSIEFPWAFFCKGINDSFVTNYISAETRRAVKREVAKQKRKQFNEQYTFEIQGLIQEILDKLPSKQKALIEEAELAKRNAEESAKAAEERRKRDAEAAAKAAEEQKSKEAEAKAKAEAERQAAEAMAAFGANEVIVTTPVKAKIKKKIVAHNQKGILAIYNFWYVNEGVKLSMTELELIHKKMIAFAEKEANKGGETVISEHVSYVNDVKAT